MANSYKMQRTKSRVLALSSKIQSDANVVMDDDAFDRAELMETGNFGQVTPTKESDLEYAGKGHSFATDTQVVKLASSWTWAGRANEWNIGFLLAMVFGKDAFTAGAAGSPNTHVLTWADNTDLAPLTNIYLAETSAIKRRLLDMGLKQLVLTASETGSIKFSAEWIGTGRYQDGALAAVPALEAAPIYLRGSDAQISLGTSGGALTSFYPRVRSWELTLDSGKEVQDRCGAGVNGAFVANGNPVIKLKLMIDADDTADIRTWAENNTELAVRFVIPIGSQTVAHPHSLTILIPRFTIPKDDLAEMASKYVGYSIELDEQSILKPANAEVITATLLNSAAQYLQAYVDE